MIEPLRELFALPLTAGILVAVIGFAIAFFLMPIVIGCLAPILRRADRDLHQTHKVPVPRLGGVALVAAFAVIAPLALIVLAPEADKLPVRFAITFSALAMFALGFWDDVRPLGAKKKMLLQVGIAVIAFYCGLKIEQFRNPITGTLYTLGWMNLPATVFWLVALTNLINLIDGIDGLAGGIALMLMCLLGYVGLGGHTYSYFVSMGTAGALLAFLLFNFPPAKIYLGDGGAYFLGYLIGALTIQNSNKGTIAAALIAPVFALALPILDVSFSIVRRGLKGLPIFRPDRRHIHHRLLDAGFSRKRAVLTLYGISLVFLFIAFIAFCSHGRLVPILFGCVFLVLLVAVPNLGMIRNWLAIGRTVGNSIEMRREVQYALLLRNWLELEAERCGSVEELWQDLQMMTRKLGFVALSVRVEGEVRQWHHPEWTQASVDTVEQELVVDGNPMRLVISAPVGAMEERRLHLMAELVAEAWLHASRRWRSTQTTPFAFSARQAKRSFAIAPDAESWGK